jgi:hypothetical protein
MVRSRVESLAWRASSPTDRPPAKWAKFDEKIVGRSLRERQIISRSEMTTLKRPARPRVFSRLHLPLAKLSARPALFRTSAPPLEGSGLRVQGSGNSAIRIRQFNRIRHGESSISHSASSSPAAAGNPKSAIEELSAVSHSRGRSGRSSRCCGWLARVPGR